MAPVAILFCVGQHLLYDRNTIEYLWLGLHNFVNFSSKEFEE